MGKKMITNGLIFFRAYVLLFVADFGLRFFGLQPTVKTILKECDSSENATAVIDWTRVAQIVRISQKTFRLYIRRQTQCLERSLVICYLLRHEGVPAQLCIGCTKSPPLFFHAWVECSGRIVNDLDSIKESYTKVSVK